MPSSLTAAGTYDRSAILRAAWRKARHELAIGLRIGIASTLRAEFRDALKATWADARAEREYVAWAAAQQAEAARVTALPIRDQQLIAARSALLFAEMSDAHNGHELVTAARAHLASLQIAA